MNLNNFSSDHMQQLAQELALRWQGPVEHEIDTDKLDTLYKETDKVSECFEKADKQKDKEKIDQLCPALIKEFNNYDKEKIIRFLVAHTSSDLGKNEKGEGAYARLHRLIVAIDKLCGSDYFNGSISVEQLASLTEIDALALDAVENQKKTFIDVTGQERRLIEMIPPELRFHIFSLLEFKKLNKLSGATQEWIVNNTFRNGLNNTLRNGINKGNIHPGEVFSNVNEMIKCLGNECLNIINLDLSSFKWIDDRGIENIVKHCPNLESLKILRREGYQPITNNSIQLIAKLDSLKTFELYLKDSYKLNEIDDFGSLRNCTNLEILNISLNVNIDLDFVQYCKKIRSLEIDAPTLTNTNGIGTARILSL